jgi:hypothetical protein
MHCCRAVFQQCTFNKAYTWEYSNSSGRFTGQIQYPSADEGAPIVDSHNGRLAVPRIFNK